MFFSKNTNGFYTIELHENNMPSDVVEINEEAYNLLMEGQSNGKKITSDENGYPILTEQEYVALQEPTKEELIAQLQTLTAKIEAL